MAFLPCHLSRTWSWKAALSHGTGPWFRWTLVRACCSDRSVLERKPLVLRASLFQHLFEIGPTEKAYAGTPVEDLSQAGQGKLLQEWARKVLEEKNPETEILDPEVGVCCDGRKRGRHMASYDFRLGTQRVEIKSAKMVWNAAHRQWYTLFAGVKLGSFARHQAAFDDLYLALMCPTGVHLIKHDLSAGVSAHGKATEVRGHKIQVNGSRGTTCWEGALHEILWKLCERGGCALVFKELFSQEGLLSTLLAQPANRSEDQVVHSGLPMSNMSFQKRGKRIQEIGLRVDQTLNPHHAFHIIMEEGLDSLGRKRSTANASADWVRGTTRIEVKSSALCFNKAHNRWQCQFTAIKQELFDELWLAIYSPIGIHFYQSESIQALGLATCGAATAHAGFQKSFSGPCGEGDPLKALKAIEAKMISKGCELVAVVEW